MAVEYERIDKQGVAWKFPSPSGDGELMMYATNIRTQGNDQRAYVKIGLPGDAAKAADDMKLRDSDARGSLANAASLQLWGVRYSDAKAAVLRERMLAFCDGLLPFWVGTGAGEYIEGDAEPSEPLWAVPGLILDGATGIHFGAAGANKSTLQRLIAMSLQYDTDAVIPIQHAADVIWVNAEEPPEEHRRQIGNVNQALGLPRTSALYTIDARGIPITELTPRLEKAVAYTGARHIFIDSLSRLAQGLSLNDNSTATLLIDSVSGLGASVNWIGHTGQDNEHRLSGSKHFKNAARLMVRVQSRQSTYGTSPELRRGLRITVDKANGAIETDEQFYSLTYHRQHGLVAAEKSESAEWPMLTCGFEYETSTGRTMQCRRQTWDGVTRYGVRCAKHRNEEEGD